MRVEKDGTKTYSDRPIPGGEPIDVKPAQGYSAPASSGISSRPPAAGSRTNSSYQSCAVTPENDSTFTNPETVPISLVTNPSVRPFDTVIMTVDGQSVGQPGTVSYTMAAPVNRGTHTVSVTITDQFGRTCVQREFVVPCHASGAELPGRSEPTRVHRAHHRVPRHTNYRMHGRGPAWRLNTSSRPR